MYLPEMGQKIRQLRSQRNISQIALAKQLGVSKSVISSYENEIHYPPYDVLLQMARLFGVSTDYLLGATGNRMINVDGSNQPHLVSFLIFCTPSSIFLHLSDIPTQLERKISKENKKAEVLSVIIGEDFCYTTSRT